MDNDHTEQGPADMARLNSYSSDRSRFSIEREADRFHAALPATNENRAPISMSLGLNGMLKNTTETGDIGQFSIKPLRGPYPVKTQRFDSPRKLVATHGGFPANRSNQNYGANIKTPIIDDRKRLPSYARDLKDDTASMYETGSRDGINGSRMLESSGCRSHSMTQSSYTSYLPLGNHKSYASLRSQPEVNLVQRPRSPFPYPSRLKRPGFRPSSPVLSNEGGVDYSRRAEIDRLPNVPRINTSSPSSFYARQKGPAAISIRSDANRSTPSLLGFSSSPRHPSQSPRTTTGESIQDWTSRNEFTTGRPSWPSPARSTLSFASSVNLYFPGPQGSATTTPGKSPLPPLYYDYTEDFDIDDATSQRTIADDPPCPPFLIDRTIHEDRELSSEWPKLDANDVGELDRGATTSNGRGYQSALCDMPEERVSLDHNSLRSNLQTPTPISINSRSHSICGVKSNFNENQHPFHSPSLCAKTPKYQLSTSVVHPTFNTVDEKDMHGSSKSPEYYNSFDYEESLDMDSLSNRSSSYSLSTHLPKFPKPPDRLLQISTDPTRNCRGSTEQQRYAVPPGDAVSTVKVVHGARISIHPNSNIGIVEDMPGIISEPRNISSDRSQRLISTHDGRTRSTRFQSLDLGLSDLTQLIKNFERPSPPLLSTEILPYNVDFSSNSKAKDEPQRNIHYRPPNQTNGMLVLYDPLPLLNKYKEDKDPRTSISQMHDRVNVAFGAGHGTLGNENKHESDGRIPNSIPNFSHQIRNSLSRSSSPLLAPKPISPARELRLKNSIPQLMKALPLIPTRESIRALSPPLQSSMIEMPFRFSPFLLETRLAPQSITHNSDTESTSGEQLSLWSNDRQSEQIFQSQFQLPPTKFKLKSRSSTIARPLSLSDSQPVSLYDDSYPWSDDKPHVRLRGLAGSERRALRRSQKFKLRVTRSSNSSFGTVRVNKDPSNQNAFGGLDIRNPKDLFTSSVSLTEMFRQVSKHILPRRTSASTNSIAAEENGVSVPTMMPNLIGPQSSTIGFFGISPTDVRSFFSDDSSQIQEPLGLRKRLSNLRARIPVPYLSRVPTRQSTNDLAYRRRTADIDSASRRFKINTTFLNREEVRVSGKRRRKLKKKFSRWFRDAQTIVKGYRKSRHQSDELPFYSHV